MQTIRDRLTKEDLAKGKPAGLFKYLRDQTIDKQTAPPKYVPNASELREIMIALRNSAPEEYLRSMADHDSYVDKIVDWLNEFRKDPVKWGEAIAPTILVSVTSAHHGSVSLMMRRR